VRNRASSDQGFSLIETVVALGVLTTGVLGATAVLVAGMQNLSSSPSDVIVSEKATEAVESVFAARDSHRLSWSQIRNVADEGVFVDGPTDLTTPGPDGLVNTEDDGGMEEIDMQTRTQRLEGFTREIRIEDVPDTNGQLRSITVIITFQAWPAKRTYTLKTYISSFA
jgi:type II secretory pathway pseudopilin PulG